MALKAEEERKAHQYSSFVSDADNLMRNKQYSQAREKYQGALAFRPNDSYAAGRLSEAEDNLSAISRRAKEIEELDHAITAKREQFSSLFVTENQSVLKVIAQSKLAESGIQTQNLSYPYGKDVFLKLDAALHLLMESYQSETAENKLANGNKVVEFLDKSIALTSGSSTSKVTLKLIKRADTTDELLVLLNR